MAQSFQSLSDQMADAVESVAPSVVRIGGRRRMGASGVVWAADGLIVTADHVVRREHVTVGLPSGEKVSASVVGRDPTTDLAILRLDSGGLTAATWDDGNLRVGQLALALARPGRGVQATLGVVSALGESWHTGAGGEIDRYLQTDVLMYPGFSGGPLLVGSAFAGINSSALLRGASVTIPATTVRRVVEALLSHGHIRRGFLGISTQPVRLPEPLAESVGQATGLLVSNVEPGTPAAEGGLLMGDTLVRLDGETVGDHEDLVTLLSGDRVGRKVPVQVVRGGELRDLNITIGERA
jgi:S1-C subfamily serine protease